MNADLPVIQCIHQFWYALLYDLFGCIIRSARSEAGSFGGEVSGFSTILVQGGKISTLKLFAPTIPAVAASQLLLDGFSDCDTFRDAEVLTDRVLLEFSINDVVDMENLDGYALPSQNAARRKAAPPKNQAILLIDADGLEQSEFLDRLGKSLYITQVLTESLANGYA